LLQAAWHTADRRRFNKLVEWARKILTPLAEQNIGPAMWILMSIPDPKSKSISHQEFERQHRSRAEEAARCGSASAMFFLGCELDQEPTLKESSRYFEQATALGHTYSRWCYGLNLLSGRGTAKDEARGLSLIRQAAEEKFEGAIQFVSHAYAQGLRLSKGPRARSRVVVKAKGQRCHSLLTPSPAVNRTTEKLRFSVPSAAPRLRRPVTLNVEAVEKPLLPRPDNAFGIIRHPSTGAVQCPASRPPTTA
jgi:hypothetical protein